MSDSLERQFQNAMDRLMFSPSEKNRIVEKINAKTKQESGEKNIMKKWTLGKVAAVAAIVVAASGGVVYAASVITGTSVHANVSDYKYTYEQSEQMEKKAGIDADIPESFSTGYSFDKAAILAPEGLDDTGSVVDTWSEIDVNYVNEAQDTISLSIQDAVHASGESTSHTETREVGGVTVNYDLDEYVFLPPSAEETGLSPEIQERLENDPHFFIGYGSDTEEHTFFSNISFVKDGVFYLLYGHDTSLSADDLFTMSSEIINMD